MLTVREQSRIGKSDSEFKPTPSLVDKTENQENKSKIREFRSWSVCFAIVGFLTGLLKYLKIGVTMDSVTSILFYSSIFALTYFIFRIVSLSKNPARIKSNSYHGLN